MKPYFKTMLCCYALLLLNAVCFAEKNYAKEGVLTRHKWTLVEITQNDHDTLTNLTLFLTDCEKDNFINYLSNGSYQIFEGSKKCDNASSDIKGEGTWKFESDSTLLESYQGGKKIPKKILTLSDQILKIQYSGEGKIFTLTYFSEEGQKDDSNKDLVVDNSDPAQNITQIIRSYLESTGYHIIASRKDFQNGTPTKEDDKNGLKPTVAVIPFTSSAKEIVNSTERNNQLAEQAKKSGIDYVITGNLINAEAKQNGQSYEGSVKYEMFILDMANGGRQSKILSDQDASAAQPEKKKGSWLTKALDVTGKVATGVMSVAGSYYMPYSYYGYYNTNYYSTYNTLFKASRIANTASTTASVFSDVNQTLRDQTYQKNNATSVAVSKTAANVKAFIAENAMPKIKINEIKGSGKKAEIIIEAGSNIGLKKGDKLSAVKFSTSTIAGAVLQRKTILGEIEIKELIEDRAASCSFDKKADDLIKLFKETPADIMVVPDIKIPSAK